MDNKQTIKYFNYNFVHGKQSNTSKCVRFVCTYILVRTTYILTVSYELWLIGVVSACCWCCDWSVLAAIAGGQSWFPVVACATILAPQGGVGFWHLIKYVFILNKFIYIIDILKVSQSEILVIFIYLYMNVLGRVHDTVDVIPVNYKITHWYANIYNHNKNNLTQVNRGLV